MDAVPLPDTPQSCGAQGCYACWDGDHLSESAYHRLLELEARLTLAVETYFVPRTPTPKRHGA